MVLIKLSLQIWNDSYLNIIKIYCISIKTKYSLFNLFSSLKSLN